MGVSDKIEQYSARIQESAKSSAISFVSGTLKVFTASAYALTISLIFQEVMGFGAFSFVFLFLVVGSMVLKIIWNWSMASVLVFDLVSVLVALLLRMYILMAP